MAGKLFLLSAPSGCGKTTVVCRVVEELKTFCPIERVVTYTSRLARETDRPGFDYHFLSANEFQRLIQQDFFLEWSTAYGHYYGTPRDLIKRVEAGISHIAVVDRAGLRSITDKYQQAVAIWLEPPSFEVLEQRLRGRGTELEEECIKRLNLARQEIEQERVERLCKYCVINDTIESSLDRLKQIILAELDLG